MDPLEQVWIESVAFAHIHMCMHVMADHQQHQQGAAGRASHPLAAEMVAVTAAARLATEITTIHDALFICVSEAYWNGNPVSKK